ncbi:MAG: hypothetical protein QM785_09205 [Pyrinomonadaceae bacterium]
MKNIDMSEKAVELRLRQLDQLHALSLSLLRSGRDHYEKMREQGKATEKDLVRFKKYLV